MFVSLFSSTQMTTYLVKYIYHLYHLPYLTQFIETVKVKKKKCSEQEGDLHSAKKVYIPSI